MFSQELVLLGLLMDGPKHGYQLKKLMEKIHGLFATMDTKSIYYPLKVMEKQGLITKEVDREGNRPERSVYSVTSRGKMRFFKLLNDNFLVIQRPFINVDLSLYFFPFVEKGLAKKRLKIRLKGLERVKKWLQERQKESIEEHLLFIIEHNLELVEAEIKFTGKLIDSLNKSEYTTGSSS